MKRILVLLVLMALAPMARAEYELWTNVLPAVPSTSYTDFDWRAFGHSDVMVTSDVSRTTLSNIILRLSRPRRGTVYLDVLDGVVSNGRYVATIPYTNFPPASTYWTEMLGYSGGNTASPSRVLAAGMVTIDWSVWQNTNGSSWVNPAGDDVIGPPLHTLSPLSGWPFVEAVTSDDTNTLVATRTGNDISLHVPAGAGSGDITAVTVGAGVAGGAASGAADIALSNNVLAAVSQVEAGSNLWNGLLTNDWASVAGQSAAIGMVNTNADAAKALADLATTAAEAQVAATNAYLRAVETAGNAASAATWTDAQTPNAVLRDGSRSVTNRLRFGDPGAADDSGYVWGEDSDLWLAATSTVRLVGLAVAMDATTATLNNSNLLTAGNVSGADITAGTVPIARLPLYAAGGTGVVASAAGIDTNTVLHADGQFRTVTATASGDNLGDHTATMDLDGAGFAITNVARLAGPQAEISIGPTNSAGGVVEIFHTPDDTNGLRFVGGSSILEGPGGGLKLNSRYDIWLNMDQSGDLYIDWPTASGIMNLAVEGTNYSGKSGHGFIKGWLVDTNALDGHIGNVGARTLQPLDADLTRLAGNDGTALTGLVLRVENWQAPAGLVSNNTGTVYIGTNDNAGAGGSFTGIVHSAEFTGSGETASALTLAAGALNSNVLDAATIAFVRDGGAAATNMPTTPWTDYVDVWTTSYTQAMTNASFQTVSYDTEFFDAQNLFDITNQYMTFSSTGMVYISPTVRLGSLADTKTAFGQIMRNADVVQYSDAAAQGAATSPWIPAHYAGYNDAASNRWYYQIRNNDTTSRNTIPSGSGPNMVLRAHRLRNAGE